MKNTIQETSLSKKTTFYFKNLSILQNLGNIAQTLTLWEVSNLEKALGKVDFYYIDAMYRVLIKRYFPGIERLEKVTAKKQLETTANNMLTALKTQKNIHLSAHDFFALYQYCQLVQPLLTHQFSSEPLTRYATSFIKVIQDNYPSVWNILQEPSTQRAESMLCTLFKNNNLAEIKLFLNHQGQKISEDTKTFMLKQTAIQGNLALTKFLLNYPFSTESKGWALREASRNEHLAIVELLLEPRLEKAIGAEHRGYALRSAAGRSHIDIVKRLLTYAFGKPIALEHKCMALRILATHGATQVAALLLKHLTEPNWAEHKGIALWCASKNDHLTIVRLLLEHPFGGVISLKHKVWALTEAEKNKNQDIINLLPINSNFLLIDSNLLLEDADKKQVKTPTTVDIVLNDTDETPIVAVKKTTPLYDAAKEGNVETVKKLLRDPSEEPLEYATHKGEALHIAVEHHHVAVVKLLLEYPFEPISEEVKGQELVCSAKTGDLEIVRLLLEHTSLEPISLDWKQKALTEAEDNGHAHIVTLLCIHFSLQAPFEEIKTWTPKKSAEERDIEEAIWRSLNPTLNSSKQHQRFSI